MTLEELRRSNRDTILALAARHGAQNVRVFGSIARGEATECSDIDLLVELRPERSLMDLGGLLRDLQASIGVRVGRRHRTNASPGSAPPGARRSRSALRDDRDRLRDILRAIDRILEGTLAGRSEVQNDVKLQVWVLYHLQIIGEVSRSLSEELRQSYPDPVWSNAVGLRNILVHHYFEIDEELVWRARSGFLSRSRRQSLRQNLWCGRVACSSQTNNASPLPASGRRLRGSRAELGDSPRQPLRRSHSASANSSLAVLLPGALLRTPPIGICWPL